jgi:hypothetical protein
VRATSAQLPEARCARARILIWALDDWYLYGITITDIDFVKTFFSIIQNRLGER